MAKVRNRFISICLLFLKNSISLGNVEILEDLNLLKNPKSNILIKLSQSLDPVYDNIFQQTFSTREEKLFAIYSGLREATNKWHHHIVKGLEAFGLQANSFWATNHIFVQDATPEVIKYLIRQSSVSKIFEDPIAATISGTLADDLETEVLPTRQKREEPNSNPEKIQWNVKLVKAPQTWRQYRVRGEKISIGFIDTGIRPTHELINRNYSSQHRYIWRDAVNQKSAPYDDNGHGTACASIAIGKKGYGVAPAAKWIACKACNQEGNCLQSALYECGQWILCPTDVCGYNHNCSLAPQLVSNSWGTKESHGRYYDDILKAWKAADLYPVFEVGNFGPECETYGYPAHNRIAYSIGSVNQKLIQSTFSSRGPPVDRGDPDSDRNHLTPIIVAPGENIRCAGNKSDIHYQIGTGTSYACAHASGGFALIVEYHIGHQYFRLESLLYRSRRDVTSTEKYCHIEKYRPNDNIGYGLLDIQNCMHDKL